MAVSRCLPGRRSVKGKNVEGVLDKKAVLLFALHRPSPLPLLPPTSPQAPFIQQSSGSHFSAVVNSSRTLPGLISPPSPLIGGTRDSGSWNEIDTKQNALRFNERESDKAWAKRYYRILNTAAAQGSDIMRNPPSLLNQDPHVFGTDYLASVKPQCADSYPGFISCWDILWSSVSTSGPNTWTLTFLQHLA